MNKLAALVIAAGIVTLAANAMADTTPPARPMPVHVVKSPVARPVSGQTVRVDNSAPRPLTQGR